ncbi:MAG: hypothetical protein JST89_26400 [Cyanobacteria bacterium SZAS-4]|nr:hypothetical protein [Cyanobacteria bacterium SZAS-4]
MQALIEHISSWISTRNVVEVAEIATFPPLTASEAQNQTPDANTSVWSFYFNCVSKADS